MTFTFNDLKPGYVVELRRGTFCFVTSKHHMTTDDTLSGGTLLRKPTTIKLQVDEDLYIGRYSLDMKNTDSINYDIVAVYGFPTTYKDSFYHEWGIKFTNKNRKLLWKRE